MQNTATKHRKLPQLPLLGKWALGYLLVPLFSFGLVYFWRLAFNPLPLPQLGAGLVVTGVASILYGVLFFIGYVCRGRLALQAALFVFVLGLLFCFFTAPLQVPDESRHYLRAYSIASGHFDYDYLRGYPNDVNLLLENFPSSPGMNHRIMYEANSTLATSAVQSYRWALQQGLTSVVQTTEPIGSFSVIPYLPQATGMFIARLMGFTALGQLYAGRIGNLLFYAAICYLAFRNCSKYRGVFFAAALLPLSLFMAASCSTDSLMLACCYLAVSYFCKEKVYTTDLLVFGLAIAYATCIKPVNFVLAALLLLIPEARWKSKLNPWLITLGFAAAAVVVYLAAGRLNNLRVFNYPAELPRGSSGYVNGKDQLLFVLGNPPAFLARMLLTLYEEAGFLFKTGLLGNMDMSLPLVGGFSVLSLGAASALGIQQKEDTKATGAVALLLAAAFYAAAVMGGIYLYESEVGSVRITGLQARYFLPVFLLLFMLASILLGKAVRPRLAVQGTMARTEQITLYIAVVLAFFTAVLLFQNYYIGQWIPKSEGGWKMVNMLQWWVL